MSQGTPGGSFQYAACTSVDMQIDIIYLTHGVEFICSIELQAGATVETAIRKSGLLAACPEVSLDKNQVGIFGKVVALSTKLQAGDRVEVYRPLLVDPMEARRLRAEKCEDSS